MKKRILSVILCVVLLVMFTPPMNVPAAQTSGDVRLGLIHPANRLDPQLAQNSTEALLVEQIFLGLVGLDEEGNITPELAQSWEISDDGLAYTFNLRPEVPWIGANRRPARNVTADDVGFSFDRARQFGNFEGVIEGVEVVDDFTIIIFLQEFFPEFLTVLAVSPAAKIVPIDLVLEAGEDAWTSPGTVWGNGPYLLADRAGQTVVLEANPFWEGDRTGQVQAVRVEYTEDPFDALRRFGNDEFDLIELYPEFRELIEQDPVFRRSTHDEPGRPLDLFNDTFFAQQTGFGHSYLVKEFLLPAYSAYFGLGGIHLWRFNDQLPEVQVADNTRVLNEETLGALQTLDEQGTLVFERRTAQLELIQPGDILAGDSTLIVGTDVAPYGFLRRVANAYSDGSRFVVETDPAALEEAVRQGEQSAPILLDFGNTFIEQDHPISALPQGEGIVPIKYVPPYAGVQITIDEVVYDEDGDENTKNDQVRASGSLTIEPDAKTNLSLKIQNHQLQSFNFSTALREKVNIKLYSSIDVVSFGKRVELKRITFMPYTVFIGPVPIVITPRLSVYVGADGSISVGVSTGIDQSSTITTRVWYESGGWNKDFSLSDHSISDIKTDWNVSAKAKAYAGPELSVLLYGVAGPYGQITGYLSLSGSPTSDPLWKLTAGIKAELGVKIDVLSFKVYSDPFEVTILPEELLNKAGGGVPTPTNIPPVVTPVPPSDSCSSNWWPPGCWAWWVWVIVVVVVILILLMVFG